jgi:hypothetical protein
VVEDLSSKHEALSSNPSTTKKYSWNHVTSSYFKDLDTKEQKERDNIHPLLKPAG